ncbi:MAG: TonB-dependent receptor [Tannerellaceae bacterium]|nr:TonB-dependent receptor [Tannerellaceae bacterium]
MLKVKSGEKRATLTLMLVALFLLNSAIGFTQSLTVTGVVRDNTGDLLIGVNVVEKGTTNGTITGIDGDFSLNVERGETLVFSYIGYEPQEIVVNQNVINVTLSDDTQRLDEVVVIGYGSMTRKDVTSSITTIKAEDLNVGVYTSPAELLQGKVPGLTITTSSDPNANPSITLRGASTFREGAAMEPYYVIDGVPGVSLATVAPDDIESIDVLRDASATAIYGSKAANGVIIVTTKRGKAGQTSVNYSGYVAFNRIRKNLDMMNADEYRSYINDNNFSMDPNEDFGGYTNWQDEVQRTGVSTNHNVSMTGGSEKTRYSASINYLKNEGVIKGTDMERFIGRAFVETKTLQDRLRLAFNVNASVTQQNKVPSLDQGRSVFDAMNYYLPVSPVKNEDGSWFEYTGRSQYYNPVALIEENTDFTKTKRIQANAKATLQILPELTYNIDLSYQNENINYNSYYSTNSPLGTNGRASRASVENEKKMMEMYFNYDKTFNDVHKFGAMVGYSWEENNDNDGFRATTSGFVSDDLLYYNLGMGNVVEIDEAGFGNYYLSTLRMISFFGRANYSFASKYLLQATVRRDGSSAFGSNNRWATFPSVSAAWRLGEETFIKNLDVFDDLKFRVGYGVSGNSLGFDAFTAVQRYSYTGWYTDSNGNNAHTLGAVANSNPDLKWEKTGMFNVGLDFAFFGNRLGGTVEYYNKTTKDLIYNYPVSTTQYIYNWMTANVGEVNNKGIEVSLYATPVQTTNFTWNTSINLAHNKNEVKKISNDQYSVSYIETANLGGPGQSNLNIQRIVEGSPIGQFYVWEWAGYNEDGVSVFNEYDEDGELTGTTTTPDKKDQRASYNAQPKLNVGWNNTFNFKNFTLTAFFQGMFGQHVMNATAARYSYVSNASNTNLLKSVVNDHNPNDFNAHYLSDRYIENAGYFRLQTLSLGYNFGKIGNWVNNLNLYATCNNVFVITKYTGLDPEVYLGGLTPGNDNRQTYPRTRTFMIGVNINF